MISVIIPVYNEEKRIAATIKALLQNQNVEIIVADGGSSDTTLKMLEDLNVTVISAQRNKAIQMNSGAAIANGEILVFLHADCVFDEGWTAAIQEAIGGGFIGGCFSQKIESTNFICRLIEKSGNIRARFTKVFYGDQAIFVVKDVFIGLGGFDDVLLFEDVMFSRRLKKAGNVCVLKHKVISSARRWEKQGIIKTTLINWILTMAFLLGAEPSNLKNFM